jgi:methylated-DNA-[protein]-cysteine S-methyltransferase
MNTFTSYYSSPIGNIKISAIDTGVTSVLFVEEAIRTSMGNEHSETCKKQLEEYFKGERKEFSITCQLLGTAFQKEIWKTLKTIPFGEKISYLEMGKKVNSPNASRAVGNANSKNIILIVLPCHRVIGENGDLTGYAGGMWRKKWLLEHEGKFSGAPTQLSMFDRGF